MVPDVGSRRAAPCPLIGRVWLPAMIPSICSRAAANISLASDIMSWPVNLKQSRNYIIILLYCAESTHKQNNYCLNYKYNVLINMGGLIQYFGEMNPIHQDFISLNYSAAGSSITNLH